MRYSPLSVKRYLTWVPVEYRASSMLFLLRNCGYIRKHPEHHALLDSLFKGKQKQAKLNFLTFDRDYVEKYEQINATYESDAESFFMRAVKSLFHYRVKDHNPASRGEQQVHGMIFEEFIYESIFNSDLCDMYDATLKEIVEARKPVDAFNQRYVACSPIIERYKEVLISNVGPVAHEWFTTRPDLVAMVPVA